MTDVNPSAVPSPAPAVQYDSWDDKGNPIVSKKDPAASNAAPPQAQDSAPAPTPEKKATPEPKGESAAESGTAPKQEKKGKQTAEERIQGLIAENKILREERERSRQPEPKPDSKSEAKPAEPQKRPNVFKWTGTPEEFDKAMDAWEDHQKQQAVADFQRQQYFESQRQRNAEMLKQTVAKYPDAETRVREAATKLFKADLPQAIVDMVNVSDVLTDLLYTLSEGDTLDKFIETSRANPPKAIRALVEMELGITKETPEPTKAEAEPEKPPVEPKPRAPKPPSEVGGRGTSPEDALVAAARTNDFRAFEAEQNRRRQAAK